MLTRIEAEALKRYLEIGLKTMQFNGSASIIGQLVEAFVKDFFGESNKSAQALMEKSFEGQKERE